MLTEKKRKPEGPSLWRVLKFPIENLLRLAGSSSFNEHCDYDNNLKSFETDFYIIGEFSRLEDFLIL